MPNAGLSPVIECVCFLVHFVHLLLFFVFLLGMLDFDTLMVACCWCTCGVCGSAVAVLWLFACAEMSVTGLCAIIVCL